MATVSVKVLTCSSELVRPALVDLLRSTEYDDILRSARRLVPNTPVLPAQALNTHIHTTKHPHTSDQSTFACFSCPSVLCLHYRVRQKISM